MATHAADIARLSPVIWRHINFLWRYEFILPETVANGALRPLSRTTLAPARGGVFTGLRQ
ncbi:MAG: hypothetical protein WCK65_15720 [Rhodospirillaceae bacterium]